MPVFNDELFVDVVLPVALPQLYTYSVPAELKNEVAAGKRVVVQFGKQKIYSAIIKNIHNDKPASYEVKPIASVLDEKPVVTSEQFKLWEWIASYYMCTLGEVMAAALPSAFKLESETKILFNPAYGTDYSALTEHEYLVAEALELHHELMLHEVSKITGRKNVLPLIKQMLEKQMVLVQEELEKNFKPKKNEYVKLHENATDIFLKEAFDRLEKKSPKQFNLLLCFMKLKADFPEKPVSKQQLLKMAGCGNAVLLQLLKKNILTVFEEDDFFTVPTEQLKDKSSLNELQQEAFDEIKKQLEEHGTVLLHGVTSSGKTEVYINHIDEMVRRGKQVLYLLPEIALTTQIINRIKKHFGEKLLVYHSRFNERQRAEVWNKMILFRDYHDENNFQVIIGARSAIFLPFSNLGLIIVDEEHDSSYKQVDPAPRYHARDTSIILAGITGAKTVLGSATPSVESYYNARSGKYGLVSLTKRYAGMEMPAIEVVDIKDASRRKKMKSFFSDKLLDAMKHSLIDKQQVILFQNRRGFSPFIECRNCHWVPHCVNCDVSLTFHKKRNQLVCHYCGFATNVPAKCSACGDNDLRMLGYGTERVEDDIGIFFPDNKTSRLDYDSTRSKNSYRQILTDFEHREIDILTGTQMVTKGLDFDNVGLVGILNADNMMNFPHFRSYEKSFQLMSQVSGRAGRKFKQGKVIIQSWHADHPVIDFVVNHNYEGFYNYELQERHRFGYPPYFRITEIRMKHRDENEIENKSAAFAKELRAVLDKRVLGPVIPTVSRIKNLYQRNIIIKTEREFVSTKFRKLVQQAVDRFKAKPENRSLIIQIDVDPA